jgi:membrane-associated protease RseP (regulator of RpoE activity)
MRHLHTLLLFLLPLASSCVVVASSERNPIVSTSVTLNKLVDEDGRQVQYDLWPSAGGAPSINKVSIRTIKIAQVGITATSIENRLAQERGLDAWRGVFVERVSANSAAQEAGLNSGDVLLSIQGIDLSSAEQFKEVVASSLTPGRATTVRLLRVEPGGAWVERTLELTPKTKSVGETTTDRIPLTAPPQIKRWTGLEIATVNAELTRAVWGKNAGAALVTGVVNGSPGYAGGIRPGDMVKSCNGQSIDNAEAILAAISAGAKALDLEVEGPLGPHQSTVRTTKDTEANSRFHIPIIIDHTGRVERTETSFLDFIFQFGFNYRRTAQSSDTREPNETSSLSILPFGMFEFERSPKRSKTTIFWFITWSTKR